MAAACFLGQMCSASSLLVYTHSTFLGPLTKEFGWSRAEYFFPMLLSGVVTAAASVFVGQLADRHGVRKLLLINVAAFGVLYALLATLNGSFLQYIVLFIALDLTAVGNGPLLYTRAVASWATRRPGLLIGLVSAGVGVGGLITPRLASWIIHEWGWRMARIVLGCGVLVIALPGLWLFVRPPPPEMRAHSVDRTVATEGSMTLKQAMKSRVFLQLSVGVFLAALAPNAVLTNLTQIITDRGLPNALAGWAITGFAVAQILGRVVCGFALDRVRSSVIGGIIFLIGLPGLLLLASSSALPLIIIGALLLGVARATELELNAYFTLRFFGVKNFGAIYGALLAIFSVGAAVGPLMMGFAFDKTGSNDVGLGICIGAMVVVILCFSTLGPYRYALSAGRAANSQAKSETA